MLVLFLLYIVFLLILLILFVLLVEIDIFESFFVLLCILLLFIEMEDIDGWFLFCVLFLFFILFELFFFNVVGGVVDVEIVGYVDVIGCGLNLVFLLKGVLVDGGFWICLMDGFVFIVVFFFVLLFLMIFDMYFLGFLGILGVGFMICFIILGCRGFVRWMIGIWFRYFWFWGVRRVVVGLEGDFWGLVWVCKGFGM